MSGLSQGPRLFSIVLAVGVHLAAAVALMLVPKADPPLVDGVEIEMMADTTSVVAEEATPAVANEAQMIAETTEAVPGETASQSGEAAEQVSELDSSENEVEPQDAVETEKPVETQSPSTQKAAAISFETEVSPEPSPDGLTVEPEESVVEAPETAELVEEAKPAVAQKKKMAGAKKRRASTAGWAIVKNGQRKAFSRARISGGSRAASAYKPIFFRRMHARLPAIRARMGPGVRLAVVKVRVGASGRVLSVSILRSSGDRAFDSNVRAVIAATAFPPPPQGVSPTYYFPLALRR